MYLMTAILI
jgi:tRNA (cytidine32/guanosine34-2'-O)-methyltransferase